MRLSKIFISISLISIIFIIPLFSAESNFYFPVGEDLTFKIKWSFIRLGTMRAIVNDTLTIDGEKVYHIKVFIDSNPLLFFINRHSVFETFFNNDLKIFLFQYNEKIDGITYKAEYRFNYKDSLVHITMTDTTNPSNAIIKDHPMKGKLFDGPSLLYYARKFAVLTRTDTVYYVSYDRLNGVIIDFQGQSKPIKVQGVKKRIDSCYLEGEMQDVGIAGFSGKFRGWFARDRQAPPLKAKLKVFIGSVRLELIEWKNWTPLIE
jgi:hypothetical protein